MTEAQIKRKIVSILKKELKDKTITAKAEVVELDSFKDYDDVDNIVNEILNAVDIDGVSSFSKFQKGDTPETIAKIINDDLKETLEEERKLLITGVDSDGHKLFDTIKKNPISVQKQFDALDPKNKKIFIEFVVNEIVFDNSYSQALLKMLNSLKNFTLDKDTKQILSKYVSHNYQDDIDNYRSLIENNSNGVKKYMTRRKKTVREAWDMSNASDNKKKKGVTDGVLYVPDGKSDGYKSRDFTYVDDGAFVAGDDDFGVQIEKDGDKYVIYYGDDAGENQESFNISEDDAKELLGATKFNKLSKMVKEAKEDVPEDTIDDASDDAPDDTSDDTPEEDPNDPKVIAAKLDEFKEDCTDENDTCDEEKLKKQIKKEYKIDVEDLDVSKSSKIVARKIAKLLEEPDDSEEESEGDSKDSKDIKEAWDMSNASDNKKKKGVTDGVLYVPGGKSDGYKSKDFTDVSGGIFVAGDDDFGVQIEKDGNKYVVSYGDDAGENQKSFNISEDDAKELLGSSKFNKLSKMVQESYSVDLSEEISELFRHDLTLTEDFKSKATLIFESALNVKLNKEIKKQRQKLNEQFQEKMELLEEKQREELNESLEDLSCRVDDYLTYVAEQWMQENELAIEKGLKQEITEDFISGMKNLFNESYIDVPEEKENLLESMAQKIDSLEMKVDSQLKRNLNLKKQLNEANKNLIVSDLASDLTLYEKEKLFSLTESIDYENEDDFKEKVSSLKRHYFSEDVDYGDSDIIEEDIVSSQHINESVSEVNEAKEIDPMDVYKKALSKIYI